MSATAAAVANTANNGYGNTATPVGPRSPSSSVCSFTSSVKSEANLQVLNKYLMKTLCLSKKSSGLPGKMEYSNLLTCGLGKDNNILFRK